MSSFAIAASETAGRLLFTAATVAFDNFQHYAEKYQEDLEHEDDGLLDYLSSRH